jgi:hypothetical protein
MSHPNPYLFRINRLEWQASSRMDIAASVRSYPLHKDMDFKDVYNMFWTSYVIFLLYEHL